MYTVSDCNSPPAGKPLVARARRKKPYRRQTGYHGRQSHNFRDFNGPASLPRPTPYPPRSPEKIAVLEMRARLRLALHHHLDAPMPADVGLLPDGHKDARAAGVGGLVSCRACRAC